MFEVEMQNLLDFSLKDLEGSYLDKNNIFYSSVKVNGKSKYLMRCVCPFTCSLIYWIVNLEIRGDMLRPSSERHIYKRKRSYIIRKWINNKTQSFGTFKKIEEAKKERDNLIKCGWDWDLLVEM